MAFRHLHVHTEFSLLDGSSKIKEITARAKELGMNSLAITDHGVMYGAIDFYRAANANGIILQNSWLKEGTNIFIMMIMDA